MFYWYFVLVLFIIFFGFSMSFVQLESVAKVVPAGDVNFDKICITNNISFSHTHSLSLSLTHTLSLSLSLSGENILWSVFVSRSLSKKSWPIFVVTFYIKWVETSWSYRIFLSLSLSLYILYVQEVVTQPKILNRTILYNLVHVT